MGSGLLCYDAISEDTSAFVCAVNAVQSVTSVHSVWVGWNYKALGKTFCLS